MSNHTTGPWTHDGHERVRPVDGSQDGTNDICHVYQSRPEQIANMRLIAAAPELLEFIKNARDHALDGNSVEVVAELIGDYCSILIAKAEGKS